jgi:hypothetical protein
VEPLDIDGTTVPINWYFLKHPDVVLGRWTGKDSLYGGVGGFRVSRVKNGSRCVGRVKTV